MVFMDMNIQRTSKQKLAGLILVISMLFLPSMVNAQIKVLDKITAIVDDDVVLQSELDQRMMAVLTQICLLYTSPSPRD